MVLLDTNVLICMSNRKPGYERILARLDGRRYGEVLVSAISSAELHFGVAKSQWPVRNGARLDSLLLRFEIAAFDDEAGRAYGSLRATLERAGTPIGGMDTLIAAHALSLGATVITNNTREFGRVPGLAVEDWLAP